jgi:hypothetical protein
VFNILGWCPFKNSKKVLRDLWNEKKQKSINFCQRHSNNRFDPSWREKKCFSSNVKTF